MAKRIGATNKFAPVKGLITEANPLAFPQDAAVDLDNVIIDNQGKVSRRLGIDLEEGGSVITSGALNISANIATSTYLWERAGGQVGRNYRITQWGSKIRISEDANAISEGANVYNLSAVGTNAPYYRVQYVEAGEGLILIWRDEFPIYLYIDRSSTLTSTRILPKIRALSILEPNAVDSSPNRNLKTYPDPMSFEEEFNLRNTGWPWETKATPNDKGDGNPTIVDPVINTLAVTGDYPSHLVTYRTLKLSSAEEVQSLDTFSAYEIDKQNFGNTVVAAGHYIHDAYSFNARTLMQDEWGAGDYITPPVANYWKDLNANTWVNNKRPLTAAFLNGHALYADLDENNSTRILISQLVRRSEDLSKCYQEADPTADEVNDLVATDGWVMHPKGMGTPLRMVQNNNGVVLLCTNGAWLIGGDASFSATDYFAKKVAEFDFSSPDSVVVVENSIILFSAEGVLALAPNEFGELTVNNLSRDTIDSLYRSYTKDQLSKAVGAITESDTAVTWVIPNNGYYGEDVLRFDVRLGAFYKFSIDTGESGPKLLAPMERYVSSYETELNPLVTVDGEEITTVSGESIGEEVTLFKSTLSVLGFLAASPTSVFYATMTDTTFHDFTYTTTPYNYTSFVEFGYVYPETMIGGVQAPYIHSYFEPRNLSFDPVQVDFSEKKNTRITTHPSVFIQNSTGYNSEELGICYFVDYDVYPSDENNQLYTCGSIINNQEMYITGAGNIPHYFYTEIGKTDVKFSSESGLYDIGTNTFAYAYAMLSPFLQEAGVDFTALREEYRNWQLTDVGQGENNRISTLISADILEQRSESYNPLNYPQALEVGDFFEPDTTVLGVVLMLLPNYTETNIGLIRRTSAVRFEEIAPLSSEWIFNNTSDPLDSIGAVKEGYTGQAGLYPISPYFGRSGERNVNYSDDLRTSQPQGRSFNLSEYGAQGSAVTMYITTSSELGDGDFKDEIEALFLTGEVKVVALEGGVSIKEETYPSYVPKIGRLLQDSSSLAQLDLSIPEEGRTFALQFDISLTTFRSIINDFYYNIIAGDSLEITLTRGAS